MAFVSAAFTVAVPSVPVGSVQPYAGASAPNGWLLCNAGQYLITQYGELYSVLGTTYGTLTNGSGGAGTTHFRVPDMRGRVPMGAGTGTGLTARVLAAQVGAENHTLATSEMPVHAHGVYAGHSAGTTGLPQLSTAFDKAIYGIGELMGTAGGGASHNNMQPSLVLNYIIKAISDIPRGGITASSTPPIVTSLPANPQFGDQVVYAADATNGVYWTLQYDGSGTYPWKFVGGSPLRASNTIYPASQNTGGFTDIISGATVMAPLAGDYMVLHGGRTDSINPTVSGLIEVCAATTTIVASGTDAAAIGFEVNVTGIVRGAWQWDQKMSGVVLNETIKLQQKMTVGSFNTVFFYTRINATPIRVKAA